MTIRLLPMVGAALLCACSDTNAPEVWRFALEEPVGSLQHDAAVRFEELVEAELAGAIDVRIHPLGALGTSDDVTEQLRLGALQFAMASPGHLGKTIPAVQAFLLHFVLSDDPDVNREVLSDPTVLNVLRPLYRQRDLELLSILPEGWMVWSADRPLRTPDDFANLRMRTMTSPILLDTYRAYGASPVALPYGEVYGALQLGMIDAQVNPMFAIEEMSFFEVQSHLISARQAPFVTTLAANAAFMDSLSPERARAVRAAVETVESDLHASESALNAARLASMLDRRPELEHIVLTPAERTTFAHLARPVVDRFLERTMPHGKALVVALRDAVRRVESGR